MEIKPIPGNKNFITLDLEPVTLNLIHEILTKHLQPEHDYIFGFADLTGLLDKKFGGYTFGISIGKRLDNRIVDLVVNGPTLEYYHHYRKINEELSRISYLVSQAMNKVEILSLNISPSVSTSELNTTYKATLRTDLSHKMVATRAGLGWIGKTALFISNRFGPRLRLVTLLTSTPIHPSAKPVTESRCGACTLCIDACPIQAANGISWEPSVDRDTFFDAHKCRYQCKIFGDQFHMDIRICGICVAVCPLGIR